jgi:hypothetical protein
MESDQGAKKSNSPIDFANKGIRMVQNARNAQKIASTIQKAKKIQAAVSIAASTWEVWVPVLIIIVIVVLFLVIITTIAGQGGSSINGVSPQPGPPPVVGNNDILSWGGKILDNIQPYPTSCYGTYIYNVMLQTVTNGSYTARKKPGSACGESGSTYYCSNLIIDSYNLAGINNNFSQYVPRMIGQWPSVPGLTVRQSGNVDGLQSGDAVFWLISSAASTAQHVDMIKSIDVSSAGNGTLTTIDANTNSKENKFYVRNWNLIGKWITGNVAWFGLGPR